MAYAVSPDGMLRAGRSRRRPARVSRRHGRLARRRGGVRGIGTPNVVSPVVGAQRFGGEVLRNRPAMFLIAGYTFHSWELLGMWPGVPGGLLRGRGIRADSRRGAGRLHDLAPSHEGHAR